MKFLRAAPPVPPYLHLGSVAVSLSLSKAKEDGLHRMADEKWRQFSADLIQNRFHVRAITQRIDERGADPTYTDASYEVFYTVKDDGRGFALIEYYF